MGPSRGGIASSCGSCRIVTETADVFRSRTKIRRWLVAGPRGARGRAPSPKAIRVADWRRQSLRLRINYRYRAVVFVGHIKRVSVRRQLRPDRMFADCDRLAKDFPRID